METEREGGRYVVAWVPHEEQQPVSVPTVGDERMLHSFSRVNVAEQMNSGKGAVDFERIRYHCSVSVMVPGGVAKGLRVLLVMQESGSSKFIIGEKILWRMGRRGRTFKWYSRTSRSSRWLCSMD